MVFHGSKGWLSLDAPFNAGVYADAKIRLRTDASVETFDFGGADQYQLMVENFGSVLVGRSDSIAFTLENSLGNQLVIDQILSHAIR
jgi:hypothetical protein